MRGVRLLLVVCLISCNLFGRSEISQVVTLFSRIAYHLETTLTLSIEKHDVIGVETTIEHTNGYAFARVRLRQPSAQMYLVYSCRSMRLTEEHTLSALGKADGHYVATLCQLLQLRQRHRDDGEMIDH